MFLCHLLILTLSMEGFNQIIIFFEDYCWKTRFGHEMCNQADYKM